MGAQTLVAGCSFCDIVSGRAEASRVYEDALSLAFMEIHPVAPGDMLVIPKIHAASLEDVDEPLGTHLFHVAHHLARALRRSTLQCDGINVFLADGAAACQSVFHLHVHVFPRTVHDGFRLDVTWQDRDRSTLDADAAQVRAGLRALPSPHSHPCAGCPEPG
ncbi:HIT family protein [Streptomyces sp. NPDC047009]|uniref:HIT family protein n=1 Tax=unclassified Streptomyces TaxID=2593676 RepID=UPI0034065EB6